MAFTAYVMLLRYKPNPTFNIASEPTPAKSWPIVPLEAYKPSSQNRIKDITRLLFMVDISLNNFKG